MMKFLRDETGSMTGNAIAFFLACALLFGWLPHVIMAKNHIAAMSTFDYFTSHHFLANTFNSLGIIIFFGPIAIFLFLVFAGGSDSPKKPSTSKNNKPFDTMR